MGPGRSTEFKVGIFVTLALLTGSAIVFALGNRSALFAAKRGMYAEFSNVAGLRPGSPVRLNGIDVGVVESISFLETGRVRVDFGVREDVAHLVTAPRDPETGEGATFATLSSKGLLGDMLLDLTPWPPRPDSPPGPPVAVGGRVLSREGGGLFGALARAGEIVDEARPAIRNAREFTEALADQQFRRDLQTIAHHVAEVARMLAEENGTVSRLIRDRTLADRIETTMGSIQLASAELAATARNLRGITQEVREGEGTAHQLIYGSDGARLIRHLADAVGEAATILRDVRTGDGNAHEVLYGRAAGDLISNLTAVSADLRAIVAEVRAGRGTLGGFLVDPSIYEDIKRIVGNLERNEILRALVRYSIREDEARDPAPRAERVPERQGDR